MVYLLVPLDDRAFCVLSKASVVDKDTYEHFLYFYHGEFTFIRFDFFEGGSVYIDEVLQN